MQLKKCSLVPVVGALLFTGSAQAGLIEVTGYGAANLNIWDKIAATRSVSSTAYLNRNQQFIFDFEKFDGSLGTLTNATLNIRFSHYQRLYGYVWDQTGGYGPNPNGRSTVYAQGAGYASASLYDDVGGTAQLLSDFATAHAQVQCTSAYDSYSGGSECSTWGQETYRQSGSVSVNLMDMFGDKLFKDSLDDLFHMSLDSTGSFRVGCAFNGHNPADDYCAGNKTVNLSASYTLTYEFTEPAARDANEVPEPSMHLAFGLGLLSLGGAFYRRRNR